MQLRNGRCSPANGEQRQQRKMRCYRDECGIIARGCRPRRVLIGIRNASTHTSGRCGTPMAMARGSDSVRGPAAPEITALPSEWVSRRRARRPPRDQAGARALPVTLRSGCRARRLSASALPGLISPRTANSVPQHALRARQDATEPLEGDLSEAGIKFASPWRRMVSGGGQIRDI
jgi:hypothetical protein